MGEQKTIHVSANEEILLVTPHGEVRVKVEDNGTNCWAWDDDKWKGPNGDYMMPKPGLIDIRGEEVLYFVLTHKNKGVKP
jgi:hypothetical protein